MTGFDLEKYVEYFETASVNHKQLLHVVGDKDNQHFFHLDTEEFITNTYYFKGWACVLENIDGGFYDGGSDNIREQPNGAFSIVKKHDIKSGTHSEKVTLYKTAYTIAKQFIAKMRKDRMNRVLSGLEIDSFVYHTVNNVMGGCFGYRVTFKLNQPALLKFEPSAWNNETPLQT